MAWQYTNADQAQNVLAALQAIDPTTLQNARDRMLRTYMINLLQLVPATAGVIVRLDNDDQTHIWADVQRQPFGTYAT